MASAQVATPRPRCESDWGSAVAEDYVLVLYVTGMTPRSARAVNNIRVLCEKHLPGRYQLKVIDIYQQPEIAREEQLVAAPTLIKKIPLPMRRLIGDLSSEARVLAGLDLTPPV